MGKVFLLLILLNTVAFARPVKKRSFVLGFAPGLVSVNALMPYTQFRGWAGDVYFGSDITRSLSWRFHAIYFKARDAGSTDGADVYAVTTVPIHDGFTGLLELRLNLLPSYTFSPFIGAEVGGTYNRRSTEMTIGTGTGNFILDNFFSFTALAELGFELYLSKRVSLIFKDSLGKNGSQDFNLLRAGLEFRL